jgi:hypothetical protein
VSVRLTGALVAAFALLLVASAAAADGLSPAAQKVLDDYRADAAIAPCDHSVKTYRRTLREITPDIEEQTPAFRPAVEAALRDRQRGKRGCLGPGGEAQQNAGSGETAPATPPATPPAAQPAQPAQPAPAAPAKPAPATPVQPPAQTPAATATPTPTAAPAAPVTSSAPAGASAPQLVDRPHEGTPAGLWVALALLVLSLLAALLAFALRDAERFAGWRHAWGEAAFRAGGTWGDFRDWVRAR